MTRPSTIEAFWSHEYEAMMPCAFCEIVAGRAPAKVIARGENDIIIAPLNPVVPGHVLVIPHQHVTDITDDPMVTGACMRAAAWFTKNRGPRSFNLITSVGAAATQTVSHLHLHIVPRSEGDRLALPWTPRDCCVQRSCGNFDGRGTIDHLHRAADAVIGGGE